MPVLLTKRGDLPDVAAGSINSLLNVRRDKSAPARVFVAGGSSALSAAVLDKLDQVLQGSVGGSGYTVQRVAGDDRYATAAPTGEYFPVLLTRQGSVPAAALAVSKRDAVTNVILLGGTTVVGDGLSYPEPATPLLTIGDVFAAAPSAVPLAAEGTTANPIGKAITAGSPLLMSSWCQLSAPTKAYLSENRESITAVTPLGLDSGLDWAMPDSVVFGEDPRLRLVETSPAAQRCGSGRRVRRRRAGPHRAAVDPDPRHNRGGAGGGRGIHPRSARPWASIRAPMLARQR